MVRSFESIDTVEPDTVPRYKIIYESEETIIGHLPKLDEWVQYTGLLKIRDGGVRHR